MSENKRIVLEIPVFDIEDFCKSMKEQKRTILLLSQTGLLPKEVDKTFEGILNLFDHLQDKLVDEHNVEESMVFDRPFYGDSLTGDEEEILEKEHAQLFEIEADHITRDITENVKKLA